MIARLLTMLATALVALPALATEPPVLKPGEVLRGRFVQERFLKGFDKPVRSEGSFVLVPGRGLLWMGETPFPIITAITPAGIVQSIGGQETMRLSAAKIPFLARLYDMMGGAMAGDWKAMEGEFAVSRQDPVVTLTPRHSDTSAQPFRSISAKVGHFVEEVDVIKPDGDRDHLTFSEQRVAIQPLSTDEAAIFDGAAR